MLAARDGLEPRLAGQGARDRDDAGQRLARRQRRTQLSRVAVRDELQPAHVAAPLQVVDQRRHDIVDFVRAQLARDAAAGRRQAAQRFARGRRRWARRPARGCSARRRSRRRRRCAASARSSAAPSLSSPSAPSVTRTTNVRGPNASAWRWTSAPACFSAPARSVPFRSRSGTISFSKASIASRVAGRSSGNSGAALRSKNSALNRVDGGSASRMAQTSSRSADSPGKPDAARAIDQEEHAGGKRRRRRSPPPRQERQRRLIGRKLGHRRARFDQLGGCRTPNPRRARFARGPGHVPGGPGGRVTADVAGRAGRADAGDVDVGLSPHAQRDVGGRRQAFGRGWKPDPHLAVAGRRDHREPRAHGERRASFAGGAKQPQPDRGVRVERFGGRRDVAGRALGAVDLRGARRVAAVDAPPAGAVANLDGGQRAAVGQRHVQQRLAAAARLRGGRHDGPRDLDQRQRAARIDRDPLHGFGRACHAGGQRTSAQPEMSAAGLIATPSLAPRGGEAR